MIKIYYEGFESYEPWSGAKDVWNALSSEDKDQLEVMLEDLYPDGMSETELNDLLWHDSETVAEWLGYRDYEAMMNGDRNSWSEHYKEVLTEKFDDYDEDIISEYIEDEVSDGDSDSDVIDNFVSWYHENCAMYADDDEEEMSDEEMDEFVGMPDELKPEYMRERGL